MLTSTATVTFVPGGNLDGCRHNGLDFDEDEVMQVGTPINGLEAALEAAATKIQSVFKGFRARKSMQQKSLQM